MQPYEEFFIRFDYLPSFYFNFLICHRTNTGGWQGVLSPSQVSALSCLQTLKTIKSNSQTWGFTIRNIGRWHDLRRWQNLFSSPKSKLSHLLHILVNSSFFSLKLFRLGHCPLFYLMVVIIRNRLSYEQFGAFLANVKELNSHKQTKEVIHLVSALLLPLILYHQPCFFFS